PACDLYDSAEPDFALLSTTIHANNCAFVKEDLRRLSIRDQRQHASQPRILDHLHRVKHADRRKVSSKRHRRLVTAALADFYMRAQVRSSRTPYSFKPGCNVDAGIQLLCLKQPIV